MPTFARVVATPAACLCHRLARLRIASVSYVNPVAVGTDLFGVGWLTDQGKLVSPPSDRHGRKLGTAHGVDPAGSGAVAAAVSVVVAHAAHVPLGDVPPVVDGNTSRRSQYRRSRVLRSSNP